MTVPVTMLRVMAHSLGDGVVLEVSGGLNLENAAAMAAAGAHRLSIGALTHSTPALDMSLEMEMEP